MQESKNLKISKAEKLTKKTDGIFEWLAPIFSSLAVFMLINKGLIYFSGYRLPAIANVVLFLGVYWLINRLFFHKEQQSFESSPHPGEKWPVSGPINKLGRKGMLFTFVPTLLLSSFNPFQLVQQIRQIVGQSKTASRISGKEEYFAQYRNKVKYRLPFDEQWLIFNGGVTPQTSHSWSVLTQRYAYDFVIADKHFARHRGRGNRLKDYFCYGKPILAAADGEVVSVVNNIGAAPLVGFGVADFFCRNFAGNHIIIKHADGEFGFYAHLIKGTIPVFPGERVKQGEKIGLCGHTGHSSEPHLHFHLQDRPDFYQSMGLPVSFEEIMIDEKVFREQTFIERGTRVQNIHP